MWCVDLGWLRGALQADLLLPASVVLGGENMTKVSWVEIEDRERSFSRYCHRENILDFGKMSLIYCQLKLEQDYEKQEQI